MTNNVQLPDSNMWMVRAGEGGSYVDWFLDRGVAAVGWGEVGRIQPTDSDADLKRRFDLVFPGDRNGRFQVVKFVREVKIGDAVITYAPQRRIYHIGVIRSSVELESRMVDYGERWEYVRSVEWLHQVSRDELSADARNRLGGQLTLFQLKATTSQELRQHCVGQHNIIAPTEAVNTSMPESDTDEILDPVDILQGYIAQSDQFVEDTIAKLGPYQLQELVAGILRAMGYRTTISGPGPDRGVDIFASPDGLGLSDPRIFVEVKHRAGATGTPAIRSFLGGRRPGDRCLYISTGGFTSEARYEAARSQIPLTLIAMPELRELLVNYYETLDAETRALVPLKKVYWPVAE